MTQQDHVIASFIFLSKSKFSLLGFFYLHFFSWWWNTASLTPTFNISLWVNRCYYLTWLLNTVLLFLIIAIFNYYCRLLFSNLLPQFCCHITIQLCRTFELFQLKFCICCYWFLNVLSLTLFIKITLSKWRRNTILKQLSRSWTFDLVWILYSGVRLFFNINLFFGSYMWLDAVWYLSVQQAH